MGSEAVLIIKSVFCGYVGAILAGLVVGVTGTMFGLPEETVIAAATPTWN